MSERIRRSLTVAVVSVLLAALLGLALPVQARSADAATADGAVNEFNWE